MSLRNGTWIQTYTGVQFWPMDARPEEIHILDIAHALSMLCRFNGHCRQFYSVAEHAVLVSRAVTSEHALCGLLHDAAEAYLSDMPQPIKDELKLFQDFENDLLAIIMCRYGLSPEIPDVVRQADRQLLATEKKVLMGREPAPWIALPDPLDVRMIQCLPPGEAEALFLESFETLIAANGINRTCREFPTPPTMKVEKRDFHGNRTDRTNRDDDGSTPVC